MASICFQLMSKGTNPRKEASKEGMGCWLYSHYSTPAAIYAVLNINESVHWKKFFILRKLQKKNFTPLLYPGACIIYQLEKTHKVDRTFA